VGAAPEDTQPLLVLAAVVLVVMVGLDHIILVLTPLLEQQTVEAVVEAQLTCIKTAVTAALVLLLFDTRHKENI
jgi:hypothetical protein